MNGIKCQHTRLISFHTLLYTYPPHPPIRQMCITFPPTVPRYTNLSKSLPGYFPNTHLLPTALTLPTQTPPVTHVVSRARPVTDTSQILAGKLGCQDGYLLHLEIFILETFSSIFMQSKANF